MRGMVIDMKKRMIIFALTAAAVFLLGAAPVKADTVPVQFSDEQIKLAQLNWNAYLELVKASRGEPAFLFPGVIETINPDSVIGKAAIINHFYPMYPGYAVAPQAILDVNNNTFTNNPYFNFYPNYYCTYQYR